MSPVVQGPLAVQAVPALLQPSSQVLVLNPSPRVSQVERSSPVQTALPGLQTWGRQVEAGPQNASEGQSGSPTHSTQIPSVMLHTPSVSRQSLSLPQASRHEWATHFWSVPQSLSPRHSTQYPRSVAHT